MLSLNRKTDYALVALADMADRPEQWASARELAGRCDVPPALLMNVLKTLLGAGILQSTRGMRGGYRIAADLNGMSLFDLVRVLEKTEQVPESGDGEPACCGRYKISSSGLHGPVHAFHHKLRQFLRSVMVSDLVLPGRRIDVPVELVSTTRSVKSKTNPTPRKHAAGLASLSV